MTRREATKEALQQVNGFLQSMGKTIHEYELVPQHFSYIGLQDQTKELRAKKSIIVSQEDLNTISNLNEIQRLTFETILEKVYSNKGGAFFIDGPGIAASILPEGRTAHSRFKIPLDLTEGSVCRASKQSSLATLIKDSKLIIWDEAPTAKRIAIEALNDLLKDLMDSIQLFGGKVAVLDGDFRQTLPVVRKGTKCETIAACITNSVLWPSL
ncbi:ATP-dependent DNA helicase PIF3-like protein [Tanacetum coccineum]